MYNIPAPIQQLVDLGYGYVDQDDCVIFHEWCREFCNNALKKFGTDISKHIPGVDIFLSGNINVYGNMNVQTYIENQY